MRTAAAHVHVQACWRAGSLLRRRCVASGVWLAQGLWQAHVGGSVLQVQAAPGAGTSTAAVAGTVRHGTLCAGCQTDGAAVCSQAARAAGRAPRGCSAALRGAPVRPSPAGARAGAPCTPGVSSLLHGWIAQLLPGDVRLYGRPPLEPVLAHHACQVCPACPDTLCGCCQLLHTQVMALTKCHRLARSVWRLCDTVREHEPRSRCSTGAGRLRIKPWNPIVRSRSECRYWRETAG